MLTNSKNIHITNTYGFRNGKEKNQYKSLNE